MALKLSTTGYTVSFRLRKPPEEALCPILALVSALAIRSIPELLFPYPIGFDTPLYFVFGKNYASNGQFFPLLNFILGRLYAAGIDMVSTMKVLPTMIYGLFGFGVYFFSRLRLKLSGWESLMISAMAVLSHAALRMSWDMHKLMLAITLIILAASFEYSAKWYGRLAYGILMLLALASHELIAAIAILYLLVKTVTRFYPDLVKGHNRPNFIENLALLSICAATFYTWYALKGEPYRLYNWISGLWAAPPLSNALFEIYNLKLFLLIYATLIPFIIIGAKKESFLLTWLAFTIFGSLCTIFFPGFMLGGVWPWRYILLAFFPLSVMAGLGVKRLTGKANSRAIKALIALSALIICNVNAFPFLGLIPSPSYLEMPETMPKSMVSSSIPIWDIQPTVTLSKMIGNDAVVLTPGNFIGWVQYYTDAKVIGFTKPYKKYSLEEAVRAFKNEKLYLIWWDDAEAARLGFKKIAQVGNLRLFEYVGS